MRLRAAFMGSPDFAVPSLEAAAQACELAFVACQPDRPAGRGRKLQPPAIKRAAEALGLPVVQPTKMKDGAVAQRLRDERVDVVVVVAFGRILPADILSVPTYGCINVHASILPRWRGAAPIQRAILEGDRETGVSIMRMDEGLDTGPVFEIHRTRIGDAETSGELFARLATLGGMVLESFLRRFPAVSEPVPQTAENVTLAPMLRKDEGWTYFDRPVRQVVDHVRGMDPWPSAFTQRAGDVLKLYGARPGAPTSDKGAPGEVLRVDDDGVHIGCADGVVLIREVQPAGRRRMPAGVYARGQPFRPHECLGRERDRSGETR